MAEDSGRRVQSVGTASLDREDGCMRLVLATGNNHKLAEIRAIMPDVDVVSMKELGVSLDVTEDGASFEDNARIKAQALHELLPDSFCAADDSGLVIDALGGLPGVRSSRFMGESTSYEVKNAVILDLLRNIRKQERTARFVCSACIVSPDGSNRVFTGTMDGLIATSPAGANGFGYDPIFFLPEYGCTSAQLSPEDKNAISHRHKAFMQARDFLLKRIS